MGAHALCLWPYIQLVVEGLEGYVDFKVDAVCRSAIRESRAGKISGLFGIIGLRPSAGARGDCVYVKGWCWSKSGSH